MTDWFSSDDFVPRSMCGAWTSALMALYIAANSLIALAYFILPVSLILCLRKAKSVLGSPRQVLLFATFILACGAGHLLENVGAFVWPNYRFFAAWHWLTAIVSIATAATFPRHISSMASRPTREQVGAAALRMAEIIDQRRRDRNELEGSDAYKRLSEEVELLKQVAAGGQ